MLAYSSPQLFAVGHVLLRRLVPRHPPYALCSLIFFCFSLSIFLKFKYVWRTPLPLRSFLLISMFFSFSVFPTFRLFGLFFSCQGAMNKYRQSACILVGSSGLEPPTSRLSGVCSNLLSYKPVLTAEAVVEISGFEPLTPCLQSRCSTNWAIPPYYLGASKGSLKTT